jgi:hypothetical protein
MFKFVAGMFVGATISSGAIVVLAFRSEDIRIGVQNAVVRKVSNTLLREQPLLQEQRPVYTPPRKESPARWHSRYINK